LNLPQAVWNRDAEIMSEFQVLENSLVWDNGFTQVVCGPIYLLRPESLFITCSIVLDISDHKAVLLEVDWDEIRQGTRVGR
jgi:hypothetical protein